jgi:prophage regulatory protein
MPVKKPEDLMARFDALLDLLSEEVVREIEEKLRERKTLALPPPVAPPSPPPDSTRVGRRVLRLPEVCEKTALRRSAIYQGMKEGWFPTSIKLSHRATGWNEHEIDAYLDARTEASRGQKRSSRST